MTNSNKQAPDAAKSDAAKPKRKIRSKKMINKLLMDAARDEFQRCGFMGATTAAIARNAQVTETQLFRHFPSKTDLFRASIFEPLVGHLTEFNQRGMTAGVEEKSHREQVHFYISELQAFLNTHSRALLSLMVTQTFVADEIKGIDSLEAYFKQGASLFRHRLGPNDSGLEADLMVRISFAALMGCVMFKDLVCPQGIASEVEINNAMTQFIMDGIAMNTAAPNKT